MDRRHFLSSGASAALAVSCTPGRGLIDGAIAGAIQASTSPRTFGNAVSHHRFGVNYTPSHNWWFCWNDWNVDPIKQDLDAIAALGADHLRLMLIWPFFQPNLTW